jgi:hypothetical protein
LLYSCCIVVASWPSRPGAASLRPELLSTYSYHSALLLFPPVQLAGQPLSAPFFIRELSSGPPRLSPNTQTFNLGRGVFKASRSPPALLKEAAPRSVQAPAPTGHVPNDLVHEIRWQPPCSATQPRNVLITKLVLRPWEILLRQAHLPMHRLPQRIITGVQVRTALWDLEDADANMILGLNTGSQAKANRVVILQDKMSTKMHTDFPSCA